MSDWRKEVTCPYCNTQDRSTCVYKAMGWEHCELRSLSNSFQMTFNAQLAELDWKDIYYKKTLLLEHLLRPRCFDL